MLIANFLKYTFAGKSAIRKLSAPAEDFQIVDEITHQDTSGHDPLKQSQESAILIRHRIIIQINRLVGVVCLGSFIFIIIHPFTQADKDIPETIQNAFSMTLGYFVSALVSFVEKKPQNS